MSKKKQSNGVEKGNDEQESSEKTQDQPVVKRRFAGQEKVYSDCFKLTVANFNKNVGTMDAPLMVPTEHCHFYHTIDSSGREQNKCSSIGGHYHECKSTVDENGNLKVEVGPAIFKIKEHRKHLKRFPDEHTHKGMYIKSEEIEVRKISEDFVKMQGRIENPMNLDLSSSGMVR